MTTVTTIPLDEYGLPADDLDLPEGLFEDLNKRWSDFVGKRAFALSIEEHPSLPAPVLPSLPAKPPKEMTFWEWVKDKNEEESIGTKLWGFGASLGSVGLILHTLYLFLSSKYNYLGEDCFHMFLLTLSILFNPLWWSLFLDAINKNARWWTTIPILGIIFFIFFSAANTHIGLPDLFDFSVNHIFFWINMLLLLAATKLPWGWKEDGIKEEFIAVHKERERITTESEENINTAIEARNAKHLLLRDQFFQDPAMLQKFLNEETGHIWQKHEDTWSRRLEEIRDGIGEGKVKLSIARELEDDPNMLRIKEAAIEEVFENLDKERRDIVEAQDKLTASKKALVHIAGRLQRSFNRLQSNRELDAWLKQQRQSQEVARIALDRTKLELDITVRWFQDQLRGQSAAIEAVREMRDHDLPSTTQARLTDKQQREKAALEIARAALGKVGD